MRALVSLGEQAVKSAARHAPARSSRLGLGRERERAGFFKVGRGWGWRRGMPGWDGVTAVGIVVEGAWRGKRRLAGEGAD
jgi:hypothetical protein